jgi:tetratricopeptide (TPR) repeat protein
MKKLLSFSSRIGLSFALGLVAASISGCYHSREDLAPDADSSPPAASLQPSPPAPVPAPVPVPVPVPDAPTPPAAETASPFPPGPKNADVIDPNIYQPGSGLDSGTEPYQPLALPFPPAYVEIQDLSELARQSLAAGERGEAHHYLERTLEIKPEHPLIVNQLVNAAKWNASLYKEEKAPEKAVAALDKALKLMPGNPALTHEKARVELELGRHDAALATLATTSRRRDREAEYIRAEVEASRGDVEKALAALDGAIRFGFRDVPRIQGDPHFKPLERDAGFQSKVNDLKLRIETETQQRLDAAVNPFSKDPPDLGPVFEGSEYLVELNRNLEQGNGSDHGIALRTLDDKPFRLEEHSGRPIVVLLWGTWSLNSQKMLPSMQDLARKFKPEDLVVLLMGHEFHAAPDDQGITDLQATLRQHKVSLPCGVVPDKTALANLKVPVPGFPTTYFFGPEGRLYLYVPGYLDAPSLQALAKLLVEKRPNPPRGAR